MVQRKRLSALTFHTFLFIGALIGANIAFSLNATELPEETQILGNEQELIQRSELRPVRVTVFVHGIISIKPHLSLENFFRFLRDEINNTHYEKTVQLMREDPFFYQNQAMQNLGLQPISLRHLQRGAGASLLASATHKIEQISQPDQATENYYYSFGWSGLLSHKTRYKEAGNLYEDLIDLRNEFRAKGMEPHFRVEGYSHGGQVIMVMPKYRLEQAQDKSLLIDEIVFYGMPIHSFTATYVNDQLFGKVYNIYSPGDRIQKIDIFTIGEFCSKRCFKPSHVDGTENKVVQVEVHVIRKAGENIKKFEPRPFKDFSFTGPCKSHLWRDVSPGHTELWFFGWTPLHYRTSFPLYPLPLAAIAPYIINTVKKLEPEFTPCKPIVMTIDPGSSTTLIKTDCGCGWRVVPFISSKKLHRIRVGINKYAPYAFTNELYNYHIRVAYDEANLYHTQRKKDMRTRSCKDKSKVTGPKPSFR